MCEYKIPSWGRCKEEALPGSKYCILHVDLPEDEKSDEFKRINELKKELVKEKINNADFNFAGAKLYEIRFTSTSKVKGSLSFNGAIIREDAVFMGAEIGGSALFTDAAIGGSALFTDAAIGRNVLFRLAKIRDHANFFWSKDR